jgi:hypothetical protein
MSDLRALAARGQEREVLDQHVGGMPNCRSGAVLVYEPQDTPTDQVAADLLKAMFEARVHEQCNGGSVWGYKEREQAGRVPYTNGWIDILVQGNRRTVFFRVNGENVWSVDIPTA